MKEHDKSYETYEVLKEKFQVFISNHFTVQSLNKIHSGDTQFALNKFADISPEEFEENILMRSKMIKSERPKKIFEPIENLCDLPESFDWRNNGTVTPVKDQGSVGTCWAFSAIQNLEGQYKMKGNDLMKLSVEQIVDCDGQDDKTSINSCCGVYGGWPYLVFDYLQKAGGIASEEDYSYCSGLKEPCFPCGPPGYNATRCGPAIPYCLLKDSCQAKLDPSKFVKNLKIDDWKQTSEDEVEIAGQLMKIGPMSVALDATMLQFYHKGIFNPFLGCSKTHLNHAVLMVGWGVEGSKDYWIIKNSWGEKWGEDGYFRITRGSGECGINTQVVSAILA